MNRIATCLVALLAGLVGAHDEAGRPEGKSVPCELLATKHLVVQAKINGKGPYRLIFDTGSPVVLLNSKIGRECKLFEGGAARKGAKGGAWPGQTLVKSLEVGTVKAEDVPATVMDHPTLKAIEGIAGPIDGIVGYPFFSRFTVSIDYPAKRITLTPNNYKPDDVMLAMMASLFNRKRDASAIAPAGQWGLEIRKSGNEPGVEVETVYAGSAAAGLLQAGDRLLTLDGRWTDSVEDCFRAVAEVAPGLAVPAVIQRGGKTMTIRIAPRAGF